MTSVDHFLQIATLLRERPSLGLKQLSQDRSLHSQERRERVARAYDWIKALPRLEAYWKRTGQTESLDQLGARFLLGDQTIPAFTPTTDQERFSFPEEITKAARESFPKDAESLLEALNQRAPFTLRYHPGKTSLETVLTAFNDLGAEPGKWSPYAIRLSRGLPISEHPFYEKGWIEIQDEGSQILALLSCPTEQESALDYCMGAGGKALVWASLRPEKTRIAGFEPDTEKRKEAELRAKRAHAKLETFAPGKLAVGKGFNKVLVDVPCSRLGVLRRWVEGRIGPFTNWDELPRLQFPLLKQGSDFVKPGGLLIYSTCTFRREENERVLEKFEKSTPGFTRIDPREILPTLPTDSVRLDEKGLPSLMLRPDLHGTDGFFAGVYRRS